MKRWIYLDALRGVAILLMVVDHAYDWWLDEAGHVSALAQVTKFLGTLAAPMFLILVGIGLAFSAARAHSTHRPRRRIVRSYLLRGGRLILYGYMLNLAVFFTGDNLADLFAVDILQVIGVSIWAMIPLLWVPSWTVWAVALGAMIFGQVYAGGWLLPAPLAAYITGLAGIGYFPLALWLPFAFLGLAAGTGLARSESHGKILAGLVAGSLAGFLAVVLLNPPWGYRHPLPVFVGFSTLVVFLTMAGLWLWVERWERRGPVIRSLRDMGLASLMLYAFHHLVGFRLFSLFGWVTGRSWRGDFGVFDPLAATILFALLVVIMLVTTRLWLQRGALSARKLKLPQVKLKSQDRTNP